jgi:hypothetical protein
MNECQNDKENQGVAFDHKPKSILSEQVLSFPEAARRVPSFRQDKPTNTLTIHRWATIGIKTPQGIIKLEAVRLGGRWLTSVEAINRFSHLLTGHWVAKS